MSIVQELMNGTYRGEDAQGNRIIDAPTGLSVRAAKYIQSLETQHQQHLAMVNQLQAHQNESLGIMEYLRKEVEQLKEKNVVEEITAPTDSTATES